MNFIDKKTNEIKENKKDPSIELLRIIGCLNVIARHIKLNLKKKKNRYVNFFPIIFNSCLCADGVAIFWFIMGFFLFKKIPYKKRLKMLFIKIFIPFIITYFFYFYFEKYNLSKIEILKYLKRKTKNDYKILLYNFLTFESLESWHLWFLYVYILIILFYPFFEGLNNIFEKYEIKSYKIFFIFLIILIENDFLYNKVLSINKHGFNGLIGAIPFIFCGNELKKNINKFKNKKIFSIFIFFFIFNNYLRTYLIKNTKEFSFMKWHTSFGFINCLFLFMFAYSFYDFLNNKIIYFIIIKISSMTFYIYLIHLFVIKNIFQAYGFDLKFGKNYKSINDIFYYQIYSVFFVFIISLFISIGISIFIYILFFFKKLLLHKKIKDN